MSSSPRTYVVTGAAGFIGSNFVRSCTSRGIRVVSVDHLAHFQDRREHAGIDFGTLVDRKDLFDWLEGKTPAEPGASPAPFIPDALIHLGACSDTTQLDEDYLREWNVDYSKRLWSYASSRRIPFVYASSGATYGSGERGYEDDESKMKDLHPLNPYGRSKLLFDLWALEEEKKGHSPPHWAGFKFFNVYGFGEAHKVKMLSVPFRAFHQIQKTGTVQLFKSYRPDYADGEQKRDFVFIDDVIDVLHFALEHPLQRGIFNLGSGRARTWNDLVRAVFRALGREPQIQYIDMPEGLRERYQYFTEAPMKKLRDAGYTRPFTSIEDGVGRYMEQLLETERRS